MGSMDARSVRARYTSSCRTVSARYSCTEAQAYPSLADAPVRLTRVTDSMTVGRCLDARGWGEGTSSIIPVQNWISGNYLKNLLRSALPRCSVRLRAQLDCATEP